MLTSLYKNPFVWAALLIQIVSYVKILGKMGKRPLMGLIPVLGEYEMSQDLFRWMRSFWRPMVVIAAMLITVNIIGSHNEYGVIMIIVAIIVYSVFHIRLYWRLAKQFGKGFLFRLGIIFIPSLFLPILAFGRSRYLGKPVYEAEKPRSKFTQYLRKAGLAIVTMAELTVLVGGCFFITLLVHPLRPVAEYMMKDTAKQLSSVTDSDEIVGRDTSIGADFVKAVESQRTRDYFFPDHSGDKKVVVMEYIIGSNLEDGRGCASINIAQMLDATAKGDGLDFVVQAGGSKRWFTKGIDDSTVGRYLISGGKIETAKMLDGTMSMSDPRNLTDFIKWTKENYPADRYMLVLWDHGGGFAYGYGDDDLNKRADGESLMAASEIVGAIKDSGTQFDLIGFDACLMQNVEYANALEPYADYYLASEETEPGTGWFYTAGFGKLAEDPAISTEDFAKSMISSYDQANRALNEGNPQEASTLSLVDLTLIKPVYKELEEIYSKAADEIAENPAIYANFSAGRSNAYQFADEEQVDLIAFLNSLKKADYKQQVMADDEIDRIVKTIKTCVVYRNSDSAEGINGLATDFPYKSLTTYSSEYEQLKNFKYTKERRFFDRFCSIMGAQQMSTNDYDSFWGILTSVDYSDEPWYIKGFEDYDTANLFVDIPVTETEYGYLPELPEKTWDTILDCKVAAYLVTDEGLMYLGREHFSNEDENGHPLVSMDGIWVKVSGNVVCYETSDPIVTEEGTVYRGTVRARLNGEENITMHIEWDPVTEDNEDELTGHVTGYSLDDEKESFFMKKGLEQFETGDTIEFMFDFYDEEGKLIKTGTYGNKMHVITDEAMTVLDEAFESGSEFHYFGVLTDVFQRELMTEEIREQVK